MDETHALREGTNAPLGNKVWIREHLGDAESATRSQGTPSLSESAISIWDFTKRERQKDQVEADWRMFRGGGITSHPSDVLKPLGGCSGQEPVSHPWLQIQPYDLPTGQHAMGGRNEEPARSRTHLQHSHARHKLQAIERGFRRQESVSKGIAEAPSEPGWARELPALTGPSPSQID